MRHRETPDVDRERESPLQGLCKDCGKGTLNNDLNHAFDTYDDQGIVVCTRCGSDHVDVVRF
jgi:hypothetical protein